MSRYFSTSRNYTGIDYGSQVPIEAIAGALAGRQKSYDDNAASIDKFNAYRQSVKHLTGKIGEELGDVEAAKQLSNKYDELINTAIEKHDEDYSKIQGSIRQIKSEAVKDFGPNGIATALENRYTEYNTGITALQKRQEENKLNDADMYLSTQGLNKLGEEGNYNSLNMRSFSDRPDINDKALKFIQNAAKEKSTIFTKSNEPGGMYGYIIKDDVERKKFMNELQSYLTTIPGFNSMMQRDLEYQKAIPELNEGLNEETLRSRMDGIKEVDLQLSQFQEMLKNPKDYNTSTEEINKMIGLFTDLKSTIDDPSNSKYVSDEELEVRNYIKQKTQSFSAMEYENHEQSLTTDWVQKAYLNDKLTRKRDSDKKALEDAAARIPFLGSGNIDPLQIKTELANLPENIKKAGQLITDAQSTMSDIYNLALGPVNGLDARNAVLNPSIAKEEIKNRQTEENNFSNIMKGMYNAVQMDQEAIQQNKVPEAVDKYNASLPENQQAWITNYYNPYMVAANDLASSVVQKSSLESLQEAYFPKEVRETQAFNQAYNKYNQKLLIEAYDVDTRKTDQSILNSIMTRSEFYVSLLSEDNLPGVKDNKKLRGEILKEAGIEDIGFNTTLAWSPAIKKQIIDKATPVINAATLGSFETNGGGNAGVMADEYFGGTGQYTITNILPSITPSANLDNVLQVVLQDKNGTKADLPILINPGDQNDQLFMSVIDDVHLVAVEQGNTTLIDYTNLMTFANKFKGQTKMAYAQAGALKGETINLYLGDNTIELRPQNIIEIKGVKTQMYNGYITDKNGETTTMKATGDINKMFTEIGAAINE